MSLVGTRDAERGHPSTSMTFLTAGVDRLVPLSTWLDPRGVLGLLAVDPLAYEGLWINAPGPSVGRTRYR